MPLRFGEFLLDEDTRQLLRAGDDVRLGPKAYELLDLLVRARPKAVAKAHIRRRLWPDAFVGSGSLAVLVAELRRALGDNAREGRYLRTVYGFGYAFTAEVSAEPTLPADLDHAVARIIWREQVFPLLEGENVLGRDPRATARIDMPGVSRRHARITVQGARATIEDLGSKNGTFLGTGDQRVGGPTALPDGGEFRLGRAFLIFRNSPQNLPTATDEGR